MPRKDIERLIGRTVLDDEFRQRLFADPDQTVLEEGFELTEEELAQLKKIDAQKVNALIEELGATPRAVWK